MCTRRLGAAQAFFLPGEMRKEGTAAACGEMLHEAVLGRAIRRADSRTAEAGRDTGKTRAEHRVRRGNWRVSSSGNDDHYLRSACVGAGAEPASDSARELRGVPCADCAIAAVFSPWGEAVWRGTRAAFR